ncbi:MAG TPA: heparin lyase I family protein, partial [Solirubrobacterales bacterium]
RIVERAQAKRHPAPRTVTSPAATPASTPGLIFSGSKVNEFWLNQSAPGAVTEVPDPAGSGETALKMTVSNRDVAPITPTNGPRAQLLSPAVIEPGDEFWWSGKFFLPQNFPSNVPDWLNIVEGAYGPPFDGSPPFEIEVSGDAIRWQRNSDYEWDIPWEMPLTRDSWVSFLVHERYASDGFVELWINGEPITFFQNTSFNPNHEGQTNRLQMQTMDASNDEGPNFVVIQNYRPPGMFNSVSLYQGAMKLGSTRASVES